MPTCPGCNGEGFKMVQEDHGGPLLKDSCYKCGETGKVSDAEMRAFQVQCLIDELASVMVAKAEKNCADHPDGEDWAFAAAESGCSLEEYRHARHFQETIEIAERLAELDKASPKVMDALLRLTDPEPTPVLMWQPAVKGDPRSPFLPEAKPEADPFDNIPF
jgi:hypothetical protein